MTAPSSRFPEAEKQDEAGRPRQLAIFTNRNDAMVLEADGKSLAGNSADERGEMEAIGVESPLILEDSTLKLDPDAIPDVDVSFFARKDQNLADLTDPAAARVNLSLVPGVDVIPWSSFNYFLDRSHHTGTQAPATLLLSTTSRIIGRISAGGGIAEELTPANVRTVINVADGATANQSDVFLLSRANHTGTQSEATVVGLTADLAARELIANKGIANGYASLGSDGKIPTSQLNPLAITSTFVVASQAAQLALTAQEGDVAVRSDLNKSYIHNTGSSGTMADWQELLTPTDLVLSVNGFTGAITLTSTNIAEGSNLYYTDERVDDRVAALLQSGGGITWTYNDGAGTLTPGIANLVLSQFASGVVDNDTSLTADSSTRVATQHAAKTYTDSKVPKIISSLADGGGLADTDYFVVDQGSGAVKRTIVLLKTLMKALFDTLYMPINKPRIIHIIDYPTYRDGVTPDDSAFNSAMSLGNIIVIDGGTYRISASATWPDYKTFIVEPGAVLQFDAGVTITCRGTWLAEKRRQCFSGSGNLIGLSKVYPEWWGGYADNSTNCAPAFTKAIACGEARSFALGETLCMSLGTGTYRIGSAIVFHLAPWLNWHVEGTGSFSSAIVPTSNFGTYAVLFDPIDLGGYATGEAQISDFSVSALTAGNAPEYGLMLGNSTVHFNSTILSWVGINRIHSRGFAKCIGLWNVAGMLLDNCSTDHVDESGATTSGATGFVITANSGGFCGDMNFMNCQAIADANGQCLDIHDYGRSNVNLAGIGIRGFDFYGTNSGSMVNDYVRIYATASGSALGDIWISGTRNQFEGALGGGAGGVDIRAENGAVIADVHVNDLYLVGYGFRNPLKASVASGGSIFDLFITDNWINNATQEAIYVNGGGGTMYNVTIADNQIRGFAGGPITGAVIYSQDCSNINIHDNIGYPLGGSATSFISIVNGDWVTAHDNTSGGGVSNGILTSGVGVHNNIHHNI